MKASSELVASKKKPFMNGKITFLIFLMLITASFIVTICPANAETWGDFDYQLINVDTEVEITGYHGLGGDVEIPSIIDGKPVTSIGDWSFSYCTSITSITIPGSVENIGNVAFYSCTSLIAVTISYGLMTIGYQAFGDCTSMTSIALPDSITIIGGSSFSNCISLISITIPGNVKTIDTFTFSECTSLAYVTISDGVTTIGQYAFSQCTALTSVNIPASVTSIGEYAPYSCFQECTSMTSINVDPSNTNYASVDGVLYDKNKNVLFNCPAGKTGALTIPDGVTTIGQAAFLCSAITTLIIPEGVSTIGFMAFSYSTSLTSVTLPNSLVSIESKGFFECYSLTSVFIGGNVSSIGPQAFENCYALTSVTISDGVTIIAERMFKYCTSLTSVTIPSSITAIEGEAFYWCTSLTSVTIPGNVTSVGWGAFYSCISLASVTISDGVMTIGDSAFGDCHSLTSILFPESITTIGPNAFIMCHSLNSVIFQEGITTIGDGAFCLCSAMTSVNIPASVTSIGEYAPYSCFQECTSMTSINVDPSNANYASVDGVLYDKNKNVLIACPAGKTGALTIPDGVTTIGDWAFLISALNFVVIPESVTTIGESTFQECRSIVSIEIPDNVTSIGRSAFLGCSNMISVIIGNGVSTIEPSTFASCSIVSMVIGSGVTTIGLGAFEYCSSLTSITFLGLLAPTSVEWDWILFAPEAIRGHAYPESNFPAPGELFHGLLMGDFISGTYPNAPTNLVATPGDEIVYLEWTEPGYDGGSPILGYFIYRSTTSGGPHIQLGGTSTSLFFEDTTVNNGITYYYVTSAINANGESSYSNEVSVTPTSGTPSITAFYDDLDGFNLAAGYPPIVINFDDITPGEDLTGDTINGVTFEVDPMVESAPLLVVIANETYPLPGYTPQETPDNRLFSTTGTNVLSPGGIQLAPGPNVTVENDDIIISFTIPVSAVGFDILYQLLDGSSLTSISIFDPFGYEIYYHEMIPIGSSGTGGAAFAGFVSDSKNIAMVIIDDYDDDNVFVDNNIGLDTIRFYYDSSYTPPSEPNQLTAVPGNEEVELNWLQPSTDGGSAIIGYNVYRSTNPGEETLLTALGNVQMFTDTGLTNGVTYYYKVTAINSVGEGPFSDEASASPAKVPSAPTITSAEPGDAEVALQWTAPSSNGGATITGYKVYRGAVSGGETLLTTLGNVLLFTDTSVINGQTYFYRVSAVNSVGEGALSNEVDATPTPAPVEPSAPQDLLATPGNAQVTLTWSAPVSNGGAVITAYNVYRGASSGGETLLISLGNVLTYTDHAVSNGVTYYYKVTAENSVGEGPFSDEVSAKPVTVPSAPQNLVATAGNAQIVLTWSAPSNNGGESITGYKVYRGTTSGGETLLITLGNVLTYTNTGLTNGETYYYKVSAVNSVGEGPFSNEDSATPATVPNAPQGLVATPGDAQVILTWSAPSSNGGSTITAYKIYRSTTSGTETLLDTIGNVLTYTDTAVSNGQIYYYRVSAVNSVGEGPLSNEDSATPVPTPVPPSPPQDLVAAPGNAQIVLTWSVPASDGGAAITAYNVYRGTTSGGETLLITLGNVLTYTNTGLTNGQTYYYKVSAVNAIGESALSNEASATPVTTPSVPLDLAAAPGDAQVILTWSPPSTNGGASITAYKVYRSTTSGTETLLVTLGNILTYTDTAVSNGQIYYYKVSATNSVGEGTLSNEVSATPTPEPTPPTPPQDLVAAPGNSQVVLTWSAPASDGGASIIGYNVYRSTSPGTETLLISLGDLLTYTNTGLTNGVTYYYRVSAVNSEGESAFSNEAWATPATVPTSPLDLVATPGDAQVVLTWNVPTDEGGASITSYCVYRSTSPGTETLLITLGNVLTYTDTVVSNGQIYYYRVSAVNSVGEGPLSNEAYAIPEVITEPSAPLNLVAAQDVAKVILTWEAPADEGGSSVIQYIVYRGESSGSETPVATLDDVLSFIDVNVTVGQTYFYVISAVNAIGEGPSSNEVNITVVSTPSAPTLVTATAGNAQVTLTWSAPSDDGGLLVAGYNVYRGTSSGTETLLITLGDVLTYTNTGLTNGQTYYYKVSAINAMGEGPLSNELSAKPVTTPSAPMGLSATGNNGQVSLSWSTPNSNGGTTITGYKIYRGTSSGTETLLTTIGNVLTYTDSAVTNGQRYYYKVSAVNSVGEGPLSSEASATPATVPSAPTDLTAAGGDAQVTLDWSAPSSNGGASITGYRIYRGTSSGTETLLVSIGNAQTYTDTAVTNGQTYFYKVKAVNSKGDSAFSNEASATSMTVPSAPQTLIATSGDAQITLSWSVPSSDGGTTITAYKLYRGTSSGGETLLTVLGDVLDYTDTAVTIGQTYYYKVSAVNAIGEGALSNEASAAPVADELDPTVVILSPEDDIYNNTGTVTITWLATDNEGGSGIAICMYSIDGIDWTSATDCCTLSSLDDGHYTVYVKAVDNAGNSGMTSVSFTVDMTDPSILTRSPIGNGHFMRDKVVVTFSEEMNKSSVTLIVSDVNGTVVWNGNTATFTPWPTLRGHKDYTVTVSGEDLAGNVIFVSWTFSTANVGKVSGVVLDENGEPVANALVRLKNVTQSYPLMIGMMTSFEGAELTTLTNANGTYEFYDVFIGNYTLNIEREGYETTTSSVSMTMDNVLTGGTDVEEMVMSDEGPDMLPYILIGVVGAVVVLLILFLLLRRKKNTPAAGKDKEGTGEDRVKKK